MAYISEDLIIVTDSDDNEDDTTHLLYQSASSKQSSSAFNSNAVPIQSKYSTNKLKPGNVSQSPHNASSISNGPTASASHSSEFNSPQGMSTINLNEPQSSRFRLESATNTIHFPDEELKNSDTTLCYDDDDVSYRQTGYHFVEQQEETHKRKLQEKKKNILMNMLLISVIGLLQSIGYVHYYPDVLHLNTSKVINQRTSSILLLATTVISSVGSYAILRIIGYKWLLFVGCVSSALFTIARFFASMSFMVPASILSGLGQGPYIVGLYCYMIQLAHDYANLCGSEQGIVTYYFTGFLHMWVLSSPAWSILLRYAFLPSESSRSFHDTFQETKCGHQFCWKTIDSTSLGSPVFEMEEVHHRSVPDMFRLQALLGCYLVCSFVGALLSWMHITEDSKSNTNLPPLPPSVKHDNEGSKGFCCSRPCSKVEFEWNWIFEPLYRICDLNCLLLVPLFIYLGVQQYLAYSTLNQGYTQCSLSLSHAFGVAATMTAASVIFSLPISCLVTYVGKVKVILPALVIQLVILVVMVTVEKWSLFNYYMSAIFWGGTGVTIQNIIIVLCVTEFPEDKASMIGCMRICQICGYILIATLQFIHVCNFVTVILAISLLALAMLCYTSLEIKLRLEAREALEHTSSMYVPLTDDATWLPHVNPVHVCRERTESLNSRIPSLDSDFDQ